MPVQLQYVQLITDKTYAADLPSGEFAVSISGTRTKRAQLTQRLRATAPSIQDEKYQIHFAPQM